MTNTENPDNSITYKFGGFTLNVGQRELQSCNIPVAIERKVMDLLLYLIRHRDRMVDKDELQDAVWPGTIVTETALTRAVMKARRAVNDSAEEQSVIRTVHGQGYRFVADVEMLSGPQSAVNDRPQRGPSITRAILVAGVVAMLAFALILIGLPEQQPAGPVNGGEPARDIGPPKVAVLPFHNLSPDPEHAYFASGIQEEILNAVARGTGIYVVARTSVAQYAETTKTIPDIAGELDVDNIIEGSIRYADNRVRITAQLVDGDSGVTVWSNSYDRDFADIFAIQSDIAQKIAGALQVEMLGGKDEPAAQASILAYREYLLARSLRDRTFVVGWGPVLDHTRRSLAHDPYFIPSLWLLHNAYQNRIVGESHEQAHEEMKAITARAIERDPDHALTLTLMAKDAAYEWRWEESKRLWDRALNADPTDPVIHGDAAFINIGAGDLKNAETIIERAIRNNPRHDWPLYARLLLERARGDVAQSIETGRLIISMGGNRAFPAAVTLCYHFAVEGDPQSVETYGETVIQMGGEQLTGLVAALASTAKREPVPVDVFRNLIATTPPPNTYKWMIVQLYTLIGEEDLALEALDDIVRSRALFSVLRIVADPAFRPLHNEPRYADFLSQAGLGERGLVGGVFR